LIAMNNTWLTFRRAAGSMVLAASLVACDPAPNYPTPQEPLVGTVQQEKGVVADGTSQEIGMLYRGYFGKDSLRITIPAGAYPVGTRVTVRIVSAFGPPGRPDQTLRRPPGWPVSPGSALQVLPASPPPALSLRVEFDMEGNEGVMDLLHAHEGDSAWVTVAEVDCNGPTVDFDIGEPGLWTLAQPPVPPTTKGDQTDAGRD
jgi:hypothetical protein